MNLWTKLAFAICILTFSSFYTQAQPIPEESLKNLEQVVWKISNSSSSAAAFAVGPNQFVTNFHVILSLLGYHKLKETEMTLSNKEGQELIVHRILKLDSITDLVLIETKKETSHYIKDISAYSKGEKLLSVGYPEGRIAQVESVGTMSYEDDWFYISPMNHSPLKGMSGSPVLNEKGELVAVATLASSNMLVMVKAKRLEELIRGESAFVCSDLDIIVCAQKGIDLLMASSKEGHSLAQYTLAHFQQNRELEFYWLKQSSEQGYAPAQNDLGWLYYNGQGVKKNLELAFYWHETSAEQGYAPAQHNLALSYYYGRGIEKNLELAFYWHETSAEQGYAPAQYDLAKMYEEGQGVKKSWAKAEYWYHKSAERGYTPAQEYLIWLYFTGGKKELRRDLKMAFSLCQKLAEQGHATAQYILAEMYEKGQGVEKNLDQAKHWYHKSAERGSTQAQNTLAYMYHHGHIVEKNVKKALYWYERAVEKEAPSQ